MPIATLTPSTKEIPIFDQVLPSTTRFSPDVTLNYTQIRLIHHYTTVTAKTLAHDAKSETVFASNLVQTACTLVTLEAFLLFFRSPVAAMLRLGTAQELKFNYLSC
jgi:hypothetical protein